MNLLPKHVINECRPLLRLNETEAGTLPYWDLKQEILKIYKPKPHDAIDKALSRTLTTRPSALGKQLIDDVCKCRPVLKSQCCADIVFGLFRRQLPIPVRNQIANKSFTKDTYKDIFDHADEVFISNKSDNAPAVAAVSADQEPEVAAISRRGGIPNQNRNSNGGGNSSNSSSKNKNNRYQNSSKNQNQGQGQPDSRGPRHPDGPPPQSCRVHWQHGKSAFYSRNI